VTFPTSFQDFINLEGFIFHERPANFAGLSVLSRLELFSGIVRLHRPGKQARTLAPLARGIATLN
jgi:hypothetical protein